MNAVPVARLSPTVVDDFLRAPVLAATPVAPVTDMASCMHWRPARTCPVCDRPARWQVGSGHTSCDDHLADVIRDAYYDHNPEASA